ncbi:type VII secretion protein EccB [Streptomyces nigrescens]|uniref:Type VII secretion protein EccB n=2 Tax=Streptomyces TaxID=1883 RepID=A0ABM7ZZT6_STRNI|nr:type VII secretion protein EccB [Streptomyces nigrescens]MEE4423438.1 type VII secretion protein EccB [Streptomyces sp. DSM 41528]BDM71863.1 type VII secretion protein EccB [Streptomyces nigrescens]
MASRRDELNAYSFARKRTNAAFLKPLPNGSIESAPKPLKAVVPSVIMGVLMLVGFGACGILKPVAPSGWDEVGKNVIVGDESTTRYIVLNTKDANGNNQKLLHPILNLASARLLLDPKFQVVKVKESELDGKIPHGPAIGIPFAPDRLPSADDADKPKTWAVCNRPGTSGADSKPQQAVFVLAGKDKQLVDDTRKGRLDFHQALYVEDPAGKKWLVDHNGMAFEFNSTALGWQPKGGKEQGDNDLRRIIFGAQAQPQKVSQQFMDTLLKVPSAIGISMPTVSGAGTPTTDKEVPAEARTVGSILEDSDGQKYVVEKDGVEQVSNFVAKLLMEGANAQQLNSNGEALKAVQVAAGSFRPKPDETGNGYSTFLGKVSGFTSPWPTDTVSAANDFAHGSQTSGLGGPTDHGVSCSVYKGTTTKYPGGEEKQLGYPNGVPDMQTWVGDDYPAKIASGASSYVTPGSGLLYTEVATPKAKSGSLFLVTDTGLRYFIPRSNDSATQAGSDKQEVDQARIHLGYGGTHPPLILKAWSTLLSNGPALDIRSAKKPQSS